MKHRYFPDLYWNASRRHPFDQRWTSSAFPASASRSAKAWSTSKARGWSTEISLRETFSSSQKILSKFRISGCREPLESARITTRPTSTPTLSCQSRGKNSKLLNWRCSGLLGHLVVVAQSVEKSLPEIHGSILVEGNYCIEHVWILIVSKRWK